MTELTRRHFLSTSVAAGAATAFVPTFAEWARAAGEAAAAGVYKYKVGKFEITQLSDGARTFPMPDNFIVNLNKDQAVAALAAVGMLDGKMTIPFSPIVVNTGKKLVAVDTGNGLGANAASNGAVGNTRKNMEAAGIDVKKIDIVLISHFHGDHIGGLKNADGSPAYPNAEIMVPAAEYAFWMDEANQAKANGFNKGQFANVKKIMDGIKVTQYQGGKEVAPGITSVFTPGHTPGHMSFVIANGGKKIFVQSDVTNVPSLFLDHPDYQPIFDNDPALAITTRRKFLDMASAEKALITGYHFPFPCVSHVEKKGTGYHLVPVKAA